MPIHYLNTDLDLVATSNLRPLAAALEAFGILALNVWQVENGSWHATFEASTQYKEPELTIKAMLHAIDHLGDANRRRWSRCKLREFNIGYDNSTEPWPFDNGLSNKTLRRIAEIGATLRITVYPATRANRKRGP